MRRCEYAIVLQTTCRQMIAKIATRGAMGSFQVVSISGLHIVCKHHRLNKSTSNV